MVLSKIILVIISFGFAGLGMYLMGDLIYIKKVGVLVCICLATLTSNEIWE